jgi:flagellar biosynthesis GTPase FlhF
VKRCSKCQEEKDEELFPTKRKIKGSICKTCISVYQKKYREENREKNKETMKTWYLEHREEQIAKTAQRKRENLESYKEWYRRWYETNKDSLRQKHNEYKEKHREEIAQYHKQYKQRNKEKINALDRNNHKQRYHTDPLFQLVAILRSRIHTTLGRKDWQKGLIYSDVLKCSVTEFLAHVGIRPSPNHHLDHICPCNQAQNEEELLKLQHYTNLRWLPAEENLSKSDSWTEEGEKMCVALLGREWVF